jgi:catechol 2,3-dioxygenase-like lactoylglutathione lyase family enzyme
MSVLRHGQILGGVITTPELDAAIVDYRDILGLTLIEKTSVSEALAETWRVPGLTGKAMATLQPKSGAACFVRLIEQSLPDSFRPTRSFGWGAYEFTVQDVYGWPKRLNGSGFDIVGPPKEIPGLPYFIPMQATGRGREMIYLNEVRENTPSSDLPKAASPVDHIFICILAAPDRARAVNWYRDKIGLDEAGTYVLEYTMINKAFDLPAGTQSALTMVQKGRLPIIEVDDYPKKAGPRETVDGGLPPGNALVTLAVERLDMIDVDPLAAPCVLDGPIYSGRRSMTVRGPAGELLELVEMD